MPVVDLIYESAPETLPLLDRSAGLHISTLIHELCVSLGHYKPRDGEPNMSMFELGNDFEWAAIARAQADDPERYYKPGELELDELAGTPDLFDVVEKAVWEFKCTYMSAKHGPGSQKFWKYERQMMAYCHMAGWVKSVLRVRFINGLWNFGQPGWGPIDLGWRYTWEPSELESNWKMLKQQAARPRMVR